MCVNLQNKKKLRCFLEKFTQLTKILHDRRSRRSRQISSLFGQKLNFKEAFVRLTSILWREKRRVFQQNRHSWTHVCYLFHHMDGYQDDIWWHRDVHRIRVLENRNKCQLNYVLGDKKCCLKLEHETVFLYGRRTRPRIDALNWAEDHEFDGHPA